MSIVESVELPCCVFDPSDAISCDASFSYGACAVWGGGMKKRSWSNQGH